MHKPLVDDLKKFIADRNGDLMRSAADLGIGYSLITKLTTYKAKFSKKVAGRLGWEKRETWVRKK